MYITGRFSKRSQLCTVHIQCVRFVFFFSILSRDVFCVYRFSPHAALQPSRVLIYNLVFVTIASMLGTSLFPGGASISCPPTCTFLVYVYRKVSLWGNEFFSHSLFFFFTRFDKVLRLADVCNPMLRHLSCCGDVLS